jgi:hypothetical protein
VNATTLIAETLAREKFPPLSRCSGRIRPMQPGCGFRRSIADVGAAIVNLVSIERLIA